MKEVAHGAATTDGFIFAQACRDKADTYPELVRESAQHKFLLLGTEVGGRFSEETAEIQKRRKRFVTPCGHMYLPKDDFFCRFVSIARYPSNITPSTATRAKD